MKYFSMEKKRRKKTSPVYGFFENGVPFGGIIVCGGEDIYFPRKYIEETAPHIRTATVRIYEGKGHLSAMTDSRFTGDIRAFIEGDI